MAASMSFRLPRGLAKVSILLCAAALLRFQHFPAFQFLQQRQLDFFRARLQCACLFVVLKDVGMGKRGVDFGLLGFQRGDFVGQCVQFAMLFVR